ncbi:hypothetical protein WMF18_39720 [Sorangium sp. So ce315]|uniref:hypothetical protein n=1 Tax=Sorangium sp. So ce315 TaxID=3133299 RepID=UPI003F609998
MRGIWKTDASGNRPPGPMAHGLPTDVWSALHERILSDPALPLLQRVWREQWGPEGDVLIQPEELPLLRAEIASLLPSVAGQPSAGVLEQLAALIEESEAQGGGLLFEAE